MTNWLENLSDEVKNNAVAVVVIGGALLFVAWDKGCFHYAQPAPVAPVVQAAPVVETATAPSADATTLPTPAEGSTH